MLYERLLKPILFGMDAESAHEKVVTSLKIASAAPGGAAILSLAVGRSPSLPVRLFGLDFPNPVGLAAGFDKHAELTGILPALGFGFIEVGSITLRSQPGNPKPRLFRYPERQAVINRMGFNSHGAASAAASLARAPRAVPIGVNLGLNKDCPKDRAAAEYAECFKTLRMLGDYFVVNVSSPNTSGLRDLQEKRHLETILEAIAGENPQKRPVLVKVAPDLADEQLDDILDVVTRWGQGIIATNTTITRPGFHSDEPVQQGGLSGRPLLPLSTELIRKVRRRSKLPVIGVGGIFNGGDALEKILAGASLVQVYTGMIYRGPTTAARVAAELADALRARGYASVAEAVGREDNP